MSLFKNAFLSYNRKDSLSFTARLYLHLQRNDYTAWFDYVNIAAGENYLLHIQSGIRNAQNFVFIMSPDSVDSPYCMAELEYAIELGKRIIPVTHIELRPDQYNLLPAEASMADWIAAKQKEHSQLNEELKPLIDNLKIENKEVLQLIEQNRQYDLDRLEHSFGEIEEVINKDTEITNYHAKLLDQAHQWNQQHKDNHMLLVGNPKTEAIRYLSVLAARDFPPYANHLQAEFVCESKKNGEGLLTDVFVSYARADKDLVKPFHTMLLKEGISTWIDLQDIQAGHYEKKIEEGIIGADSLLFLLSPNSVQSEWCLRELQIAITQNKRIVPILIAPVAAENMPKSLQQLQYSSLVDTPNNIGAIVQLLKHEREYHYLHKKIGVQAHKWQEQSQNEALLLRGNRLDEALVWLETTPTTPNTGFTNLHEQLIKQSEQKRGMRESEVFISYSRTDADFARKLNAHIQYSGKTTWFDQESIPAGAPNFEEQIQDGIRNCSNFVFVISPDSVTSRYCKEEVLFAEKHSKRITTVLLHKTEIAELEKVGLEKINWIDFERETDFNAPFWKLIRAIETDSDYVKAHTLWENKAHHWTAHHQDKGSLLAGKELIVAHAWLKDAEENPKKPALTSAQKEYINQSIQLEQEKEQAEIRAKKRLKNLLLFATLAFVLASFLGWVSWSKYLESERQRTKIENFTLQKVAEQQQSKNPTLALRLAEMAWKNSTIEQRQQSADALLSQNFGSSTNRAFYKAKFSGVTGYMPSGDFCISKHADTLLIINAKTGNNAFSWIDSTLHVIGMSENNKLMLALANTKFITVDLQNNAEVKGISLDATSASQFQYSEDGSQLFFVSDNKKSINLWSEVSNSITKVFSDHESAVEQYIAIPKQNYLVSVTSNNMLRIWNTKTSKCTYTLPQQDSKISEIIISDSGKFLLVYTNNKTLTVWNTTSGAQVYEAKNHTDEIDKNQFSEDEKKLVILYKDKSIELINTSGKPNPIKLNAKYKETSESYFLKNNTQLAALTEDGVLIWDCKTGRQVQQFQSDLELNEIVISPDGTRIAAFSSFSKHILLWSTANGQLLTKTTAHSNSISQIIFYPNSQNFVTLAWGNAAKIWSSKTGELQFKLQGHANGSWIAQISPNKKTVLTTGNTSDNLLWPIHGDSKQYHLSNYHLATAVVGLSQHNNNFATAATNGSVHIWNAKTAQKELTFRDSIKDIRQLEFSPSGNKILSLNGHGLDSKLLLWNASNGQKIATLKGHSNDIFAAHFSPNGKKIASASADRTVKIWSAENGKLLANLAAHKHMVTGVTFSKNGKHIVSMSYDKTARIWDTTTGKTIAVLNGHTTPVRMVRFSADSKYCITVGGKWDVCEAKLWNVSTGELIRDITEHNSGIQDVVFDTKGQNFATASSDKLIKVWNTNTGDFAYELKGHKSTVNKVLFSNDGKWIASASFDNSAIIWDRQTQSIKAHLKGHTNSVDEISFSPNNKYFLTNSADNTARIWRVETSSLLQQIGSDSAPTRGAYFTSDNDFVVSYSNKGASVWPLPSAIIKYLDKTPVAEITEEDLSELGLDFLN